MRRRREFVCFDREIWLGTSNGTVVQTSLNMTSQRRNIGVRMLVWLTEAFPMDVMDIMDRYPEWSIARHDIWKDERFTSAKAEVPIALVVGSLVSVQWLC